MEDNKIMSKEIRITVLISLIFAIFAVLVGPLLNDKLPYANIIIFLAAALIILYVRREDLPEKWPLQEGSRMPVSAFLIALGIIGAFQLPVAFASTAVTTAATLPDLNSILFTGIAAPICEEIVFRGVILNRLKKYGIIFSVIATTVLFGFYHLNILQLFTGALILGLMLSTVALKYSVIYTILLHAVNNLIFNILIANSGVPYLRAIVGSVCLVIGIICFFVEKYPKKINAFFKSYWKKSAKGCYRCLFLNPYFLITLAITIGLTVKVILMIFE